MLIDHQLLWLVNLSPLTYTPLGNKGFIRPYQGKPMVNKPLIRPVSSGGVCLTIAMQVGSRPPILKSGISLNGPNSDIPERGEPNDLCLFTCHGLDVLMKMSIYDWNLGGGFKDFLFSSLPGEMIQFDEHIFQGGWNHQLGNDLNNRKKWEGYENLTCHPSEE